MIAAAVMEEEEPEEEEEVPPSPVPKPRGKWICPPILEIPLKYQKNKLYFQLRIDEVPEGNVRPRIVLGFCKDDFKVDKELAR